MRKLKTLVAAATLLACGCVPAAAGAKAIGAGDAQGIVRRPIGWGRRTTIGFSFTVATTEGLAPPPLTGIDLHMPAGMNTPTTNLGLAVCQPEELAAGRPRGLPRQLAPRVRAAPTWKCRSATARARSCPKSRP